jgi:hypothetical protein
MLNGLGKEIIDTRRKFRRCLREIYFYWTKAIGIYRAKRQNIKKTFMD